MNTILSIIIYYTIYLVVWLYTIITLPIYAIVQKPWNTWHLMNKKKSRQVESSEGICFTGDDDVFPIQEEMLIHKIDTITKIFDHACQLFPNRNCFGTRKVFGESEEHQPGGKVFQKLVLGDYQWTTFSQAAHEARTFGNGLRSLKFAPKKNILIFSETRQEFMLSVLGALDQNCTVCTLYATLGDKAIVHGINETEVSVIICSSSLLPKLKRVLSKCPKVSHIIYLPDQWKETDLSELGSVQAISFPEVVKKGASLEYVACSPTPDDIAVIMYTSGSTGTPKGVMQSHRNLVSAVWQFSKAVTKSDDAVFLAYLPLAHVMEIMGELVIMLCGNPMAYSSANTLTDVSTKIKKGCKGDASLIKPTIVPTVPLILDRIYKSASQSVSSKGPLFEKIFKFFVSYRLFWLRRGWDTPVCNKVVFGKTRNLLGGRVVDIGCGGAPLAPDTHDLIRAVLGVNIPLGYGLTETCALGTVTDARSDFTTDNVGYPCRTAYLKLVNWDEGGYTINDSPNPRGEIILGGDHIAVGYYKKPELTEENFYELDGVRWFRTGDIGELQSNGSLKIIDRKKDLVKLQMGEYVSLGKIESILKLCSYVDNICVHGDSKRNNVVAIVSVSPKAIEQFSWDLENPDSNNNSITEEILNAIRRKGLQGQLNKYELPTACYVTADQWTPDNNLVTATMKLKRINIYQKYKQHIDALYFM